MKVLAVTLAGALLMAGCGDPEVTVIPRADLPPDIYGSPTPEAEAELPDRATVYLLHERRLQPTPRRIPEARSLPEGILLALLEGSSGVFRTAIPADTRLIGVTVDGGIATVNLSDEFERSATGERLARRVAQVVYTLTEASGVIAVLFQIEGAPAAVLTGDDKVVQRPVTRADYRRFAPKGDDAQSDTSEEGDEQDGG